MALYDTFAQLKSAILDDVMRSDATFMAALPRFVAQAEQRIYNGARPPMPSDPVRIKEMETVETLAVTNGEAPLPADWLGFNRLSWSGGQKSVPVYIPPAEFRMRLGSDAGSAPILYTIEGSKLYTLPIVTGMLNVAYYKRLTPLVADASTNAILTTAPDVYFNGVLMGAYRYLRDVERHQQAYTDYLSAVDALSLVDTLAMASGNTLAPILRRVV